MQNIENQFIRLVEFPEFAQVSFDRLSQTTFELDNIMKDLFRWMAYLFVIIVKIEAI